MSDLRQQLIRSLAEDGPKLRLVRSLPEVLREIQEVGPIVWCSVSHRRDWEGLTHEQRCAVLDKLDALQDEARAMIEAATGVTWEAIQEATL